MPETHKNRVISRKRIIEFLEAHPDLKSVEGPLDTWYRTALRAPWSNFAKVRESYGSADQGGEFVVFNIGGNKVRLVAEIRYSLKPRLIYVRHVLTHAEYDEIDLKA
jgi:mRNA interferase HigB